MGYSQRSAKHRRLPFDRSRVKLLLASVSSISATDSIAVLGFTATSAPDTGKVKTNRITTASYDPMKQVT